MTDEGSLPEIVQYGPSSCFECFTASKGSNNYFYPNRSDTNRAEQTHKLARGWDFFILKVEVLY